MSTGDSPNGSRRTLLIWTSLDQWNGWGRDYDYSLVSRPFYDSLEPICDHSGLSIITSDMYSIRVSIYPRHGFSFID